MSMPHQASLPSSARLRTLLGLAGLMLPTALLASCLSDDLDGELITLRPIDFEGPAPGFAVAISLGGEDVVLDWSGAQGTAVSVFRSSDPALLASLPLGNALPAGVVEVVLDPSATDYTDVGAADHDDLTPHYYYRVGIETGDARVLSQMVMKTTTAMAQGYNKLAVCMVGGPERASDVVARLGSSVVSVWGWDAVNQSYIHWTPAYGVGSAADFTIGLGGVLMAQVDGSTPAYQSLVGAVPTNEPFEVTGRPGNNWWTLPVGYSGPAMASYWVDQVGYWGVGRWDNLTQSASWYWNSDYADFGLEACQPYDMYLPGDACTSNADCGEDTFCHFVDAASCGDVAAGLCKAQPIGCEEAPQGEVCGCDGVTYPSACEAEQAGASVASEGACECPPGFAGANCDTEIDECEANPCVNGDCEDQVNAYECACSPGWTGTDCEIEIDECEADPCDNGVCVDQVNGYVCVCSPGWTGTDCEIEIDECEADPCDNGVCVDQVNGYVCVCAPGWTGTDCEIEIDECEADPCDNGVCVDQVNGYVCVCDPGWTGTDCDTPDAPPEPT
ncbi:hypothetical protein [Paraliomyxa miuraensis]|uniref:hypothetical protein n=1 Tax=Paraliomyxa miuraensis TaxID=376150 RepID=UPI00225A9E6E|nr:hypothetical protein [Paraliomyxa miuraensis]MCX4244768.1 hypothetical protein [Paraliomyxa miuraensis]